MNVNVQKSILALGLSLGLATAAQAVVVSGTYAYTATGLPTDPIVGVVRFSFDNSANFFNAANGAMANGVPVQVSISGPNLPGTWTPVLTFIRNGVVAGNPVADLMAIGHSLNGTVTAMGTDDWRVAFNTISTAPSFREFTYTRANAPGVQFQTFAGSVSAVPEPATAASLAAGLALVMLARRRRTR